MRTAGLLCPILTLGRYLRPRPVKILQKKILFGIADNYFLLLPEGFSILYNVRT
jgi:hypothetical protein